ncbi:MAG TPA: ATP synthase F1 subunit gamma [Myxococcota bacterium]
MASLRDIRKRIKSVKNTQKITKAMKMVSAAKLRRAQDRVMAARPFADKIAAAATDLARRAEALGEAPHPLLVARPQAKKGGRIELLAITSDRGLCGAFNSNVVRRALRFRYDHKDVHQSVSISTVGRKAAEAIKREGVNSRRTHNVWEGLDYAKAAAIALELTEAYVNGEIDAVHIVYNEFVNAGTQRVVVDQLLPFVAEASEGGSSVDFDYEPSREALLDALLPREIATRIYRALLESAAAEHAARMQAMENASKNAKEMVASLSLFYNRARQAAITTELMEIIGGAEALKG